MYVFTPDLHLPEDADLMSKPWKRGSPSITLSFADQDADLARDLQGSDYKALVTRQVHTLMQRLDELGMELVEDEDKRMQDERAFDYNKALFDKVQHYRNKLHRLENTSAPTNLKRRRVDPYAPEHFVRRPTRSYDKKVALKVIE